MSRNRPQLAFGFILRVTLDLGILPESVDSEAVWASLPQRTASLLGWKHWFQRAQGEEDATHGSTVADNDCPGVCWSWCKYSVQYVVDEEIVRGSAGPGATMIPPPPPWWVPRDAPPPPAIIPRNMHSFSFSFSSSRLLLVRYGC